MRRASANKNVLSSRLNSVRQMSCCRSSAGRLFHSRGSATPKLLSLSPDCVRGTVYVWTSADRRCRRPTSATSWQSPDRFGGARRGLETCYYSNRYHHHHHHHQYHLFSSQDTNK